MFIDHWKLISFAPKVFWSIFFSQHERARTISLPLDRYNQNHSWYESHWRSQTAIYININFLNLSSICPNDICISSQQWNSENKHCYGVAQHSIDEPLKLIITSLRQNTKIWSYGLSNFINSEINDGKGFCITSFLHFPTASLCSVARNSAASMVSGPFVDLMHAVLQQ